MSESVLRHLTREGDRWDLIAWRYYGNPLEISRLIAANRTCLRPSSLPPT